MKQGHDTSTKLVSYFDTPALINIIDGMSLFNNPSSGTSPMPRTGTGALTDNAPRGSDVFLGHFGWFSNRTINRFDEPYSFSFIDGAIDRNVAATFFQWLLELRDWSFADGGFFQAHERIISSPEMPDKVAQLFAPERFKNLEEDISKAIGSCVRIVGKIAAHRMDDGQGVGIHSDGPLTSEDYRLVLVFSEETSFADGGHFLFSKSLEATGPVSVARRMHNTALIIPVSGSSWHAISTVHGDPRFSVIIALKVVEPANISSGED